MADVRIPVRSQLWAHQLGSLCPEPPLLVAGAFGGPFVIGLLTPLRNACTLAAQDSHSTARQIYGRVFGLGVRSGWTGASTPAAAAALQFTMLGPGYFVYLKLLGSPAAATVAGAVTETLITYAPTTRNSQLMHNKVAAHAERVPVRPLFPVGPGFAMLTLRNTCANAGIRVLSAPIAGGLARLTAGEAGDGPVRPSGACCFGGDFCASVICGAVSMPFNQLFNYHVTSAASLSGSSLERLKLGMRFLKSQYFERSSSGSVRLSRMVLRDGGLRAMYIGCMFSSYAAVERVSLSFWRASGNGAFKTFEGSV